MYLAYKFVAITLMLAEVNLAVSRLNIPIKWPVQESEVNSALVAPPGWNWAITAGRIDIHGYSFSFSHEGKLRYIWKIKPFGKLGMADRNDMLVKEESIINETDAYIIATNWLTQMQVNVPLLQKSFPRSIRREYRWRPADIRKKDLLPLFEVKWGKWDEPEVMVEIDGRSKGLLQLRVQDECVLLRPVVVVSNRKQLSEIPDQEFLGYSRDQRRQLLERFPCEMQNSATNESVSWPKPENQSH